MGFDFPLAITVNSLLYTFVPSSTENKAGSGHGFYGTFSSSILIFPFMTSIIAPVAFNNIIQEGIKM